jgi:hypothetical protein
MTGAPTYRLNEIPAKVFFLTLLCELADTANHTGILGLDEKAVGITLLARLESCRLGDFEREMYHSLFGCAVFDRHEEERSLKPNTKTCHPPSDSRATIRAACHLHSRSNIESQRLACYDHVASSPHGDCHNAAATRHCQACSLTQSPGDKRPYRNFYRLVSSASANRKSADTSGQCAHHPNTPIRLSNLIRWRVGAPPLRGSAAIRDLSRGQE